MQNLFYLWHLHLGSKPRLVFLGLGLTLHPFFKTLKTNSGAGYTEINVRSKCLSDKILLQFV